MKLRRAHMARGLVTLGVLASALLALGPAQALGQRTPGLSNQPLAHVTQEQREAAAARMELQKQLVSSRTAGVAASGKVSALAVSALALTPTQGGVPDYFGSANWAFSPPLAKFVDDLPGLGPSKANGLGQFIAVAHPDTITFPGSDYYEIELRQYSEKMHSDLPATTLRGYVQTNNGTDVSNQNTILPDPGPHQLGPFIIAQKDRPVRIKFTNKLPNGSGGDLFLPVDTTIMGAGMGPLGMDAMPMNYTQNRATLHLHGGTSPWISDGTPHQWITPAGENTPYPKGVSVQNVPDMADPGDGSETFFYTNQQSARLLFYHDHSYGITRLNVYAGEAAGYLINDTISTSSCPTASSRQSRSRSSSRTRPSLMPRPYCRQTRRGTGAPAPRMRPAFARRRRATCGTRTSTRRHRTRPTSVA